MKMFYGDHKHNLLPQKELNVGSFDAEKMEEETQERDLRAKRRIWTCDIYCIFN